MDGVEMLMDWENRRFTEKTSKLPQITRKRTMAGKTEYIMVSGSERIQIFTTLEAPGASGDCAKFINDWVSQGNPQ
jgi:hypothetical protein